MSNARRIVIVIASLLMLGSVLFPPWVKTFQSPGMSQSLRPAGYSFIGVPPELEDRRPHVGIRIDTARLVFQLIATLAVGALLFALCPVGSSSSHSNATHALPLISIALSITSFAGIGAVCFWVASRLEQIDLHVNALEKQTAQMAKTVEDTRKGTLAALETAVKSLIKKKLAEEALDATGK